VVPPWEIRGKSWGKKKNPYKQSQGEGCSDKTGEFLCKKKNTNPEGGKKRGREKRVPVNN